MTLTPTIDTATETEDSTAICRVVSRFFLALLIVFFIVYRTAGNVSCIIHSGI